MQSQAVRAMVVAIVLALSACSLLPNDLSALRLRIINGTANDITVRPARENEIAWHLNGPNEPVRLAPGASMTRTWGPDYNSNLKASDTVTVEADSAIGVIIFCRKYSIAEITRARETITIREVDLECG
jgi:hypothetical protein